MKKEDQPETLKVLRPLASDLWDWLRKENLDLQVYSQVQGTKSKIVVRGKPKIFVPLKGRIKEVAKRLEMRNGLNNVRISFKDDFKGRRWN